MYSSMPGVFLQIVVHVGLYLHSVKSHRKKVPQLRMPCTLKKNHWINQEIPCSQFCSGKVLVQWRQSDSLKKLCSCSMIGFTHGQFYIEMETYSFIHEQGLSNAAPWAWNMLHGWFNEFLFGVCAVRPEGLDIYDQDEVHIDNCIIVLKATRICLNCPHIKHNMLTIQHAIIYCDLSMI